MQSSGVSFVGVVGGSASQAIGEEECAEIQWMQKSIRVAWSMWGTWIEQHSRLHLSATSIVHQWDREPSMVIPILHIIICKICIFRGT